MDELVFVVYAGWPFELDEAYDKRFDHFLIDYLLRDLTDVGLRNIANQMQLPIEALRVRQAICRWHVSYATTGKPPQCKVYPKLKEQPDDDAHRDD